MGLSMQDLCQFQTEKDLLAFKNLLVGICDDICSAILLRPNETDSNLLFLSYDKDPRIPGCLELQSHISELNACKAKYLPQLAKAKERALDLYSKILVAGDLNAGKSTFLNTIIGYNLLPVCEQPCTQSFCELIVSVSDDKNVGDFSISKFMNGVELEVTTCNQDELNNVLSSANDESIFNYYQIKVPLQKRILPDQFILVDSPGLNSDSLKTTALVAKNDDIDAIIFVLDACNHLTLSAQTFLKDISNDKKCVFFIVNKIDRIGSFESCKANILKQIYKLFPDIDEKYIRYVSLQRIDHTQLSSLTSSLDSFVNSKKFSSKVFPLYNISVHILGELLCILGLTERSLLDYLSYLKTALASIYKEYEEMLRVMDDAKRIFEIQTSNCLNSFKSQLQLEIDDTIRSVSKQLLSTISFSSLNRFHSISKSSFLNGISRLNAVSMERQGVYLKDMSKSIEQRFELVFENECDTCSKPLVDEVQFEKSFGFTTLISFCFRSYFLKSLIIFVPVVIKFSPFSFFWGNSLLKNSLFLSYISLFFSNALRVENYIENFSSEYARHLMSRFLVRDKFISSFSKNIDKSVDMMHSAIYTKYTKRLVSKQLKWDEYAKERKQSENYLLALTRMIDRCKNIEASLSSIKISN